MLLHSAEKYRQLCSFLDTNYVYNFYKYYIFSPTLGCWNYCLFSFYLNNIAIKIPVKLVEIISLPYIISKKGYGCKWTRDNITLQHKLKEEDFYCCSTFHNHSRVFNKENNSYPKMSVKRPLTCSWAELINKYKVLQI